MIDSKTCLLYFSLKQTLKFVAMSSSLSSSKTMWSTIDSTSTSSSIPMKDESIGESGSVLATDENETTKKLKQKRSGWWG